MYIHTRIEMGSGTSDFVETSSQLESILCRKSFSKAPYLKADALTPQSMLTIFQINFAGRPFYQIGVLGFKVALCVAYLRILSHAQRLYRIIVWVVMTTCIAGHVACTLVLIFQCKPVGDAHTTSSLFLVLTLSRSKNLGFRQRLVYA
jgi:hypothetical protein